MSTETNSSLVSTDNETKIILLTGAAANALAFIEIALNLQVMQCRGTELPFGNVCNTHIQAALIAARDELGMYITKHDNFQVVKNSI